MHCPDCPQKIEKSLLKMHGILNVNINYETESGSVAFNNNLVSVDKIIEEIDDVGFNAKVSI